MKTIALFIVLLLSSTADAQWVVNRPSTQCVGGNCYNSYNTFNYRVYNSNYFYYTPPTLVAPLGNYYTSRFNYTYYNSAYRWNTLPVNPYRRW